MKYLVFTLLTLSVCLWSYNVGTMHFALEHGDEATVASHYINQYLNTKCEKMSDKFGQSWYECDAKQPRLANDPKY